MQHRNIYQINNNKNLYIWGICIMLRIYIWGICSCNIPLYPQINSGHSHNLLHRIIHLVASLGYRSLQAQLKTSTSIIFKSFCIHFIILYTSVNESMSLDEI
ncbi:hypothetical protein BpHYR1_032558 [Brachionus plicatilis]|uniref:Uncharacterized protein n=1 Tax=Brachionus plicatilis TaxID=10195 RepID=A0A3M7RQV5_BRAPC|nr:hypothetical protein BpHYR1_032558 [Brachionus plicatilis]